MPKSTDVDRRRSPRFICAGYARINRLPSTGLIVPGKIRDLSLGGCCVDGALPIECGAQAEIVVRINTSSFRAIGQVRAVRAESGAGLEFVRLSAGGKDMLAETLRELARMQAAIARLKTAQRQTEADSFSRELTGGKLQAMILGGRIPVFESAFPVECSEGAKGNCPQPSRGADESDATIMQTAPLLIAVDLFV